MHTFWLILLGYLAGSLPSGKLIGLIFYHTDIQKRGSGNIGFANVQRVLGWPPAIATLLIDILKGYGPTLLALHMLNATAAFWIGLATIGGHVYPVWLGFRGGKGYATGLGVILGLQPIAAAIGGLVYLLCRLRKLPSSTGSYIGLVVLACSMIILRFDSWWQASILIILGTWTLRHNLLGNLADHELPTSYK